MAYWACAQLATNQERLALHCLGLARVCDLGAAHPG